MQPLPAPSLGMCLFLDVDGTLIEFTDSPLTTSADPEIKTLLRVAAAKLGGALALVSGRTIEFLDAMFAPLHLPSAGLHGVERRKASGIMHGASFIDSQLDRARRALSSWVDEHPGTVFEDKGRTVAVHFRLAPQFEAQAAELVRTVAAELGSNYHIQGGHRMLELKPRGFNKAAAIEAFLNEPPFSGRTPVFIGDDLTDRDGFRVVEDRGGMSIAVGDRVTGQYRAEDVTAVREFLGRIAALHDPHAE